MTKLNSITFNNKRLDELNVGWKTTGRPISPPRKTYKYSPTARDGELDFSSWNPDNRPHYETIQITGEIQIIRQSLEESLKTAREVVKFLHSAYGEPAPLIFDDSPDRIYIATFTESAQINDYENYKNIIIPVTFECHPFPYSKEITLTQSTGSIPLNYKGTFYTKPIITVQGSYDYLKVSSNTDPREIQLMLSVTGETILDFNNETIVVNGEDKMAFAKGDFFEIPPNKPTTITISGGSSATIQYLQYELF